MAHRLLRDTEADGWERSDFPIICETCLGANPYVRMTKANFDKECKICTRPFTVFRWRPGKDARYKKTEICQTCCKLKNVCQVCLLDLEFGLPVQVRDTAMGIDTTDAIPKSDVNREYFAEEHDKKARAGLDFESSFGKTRPSDTLLKLQRTAPYYKRNRAHICSFFVRGDCTRGAECPFRHEMPITGELAEQNIKDRYYGVNDPVAKKLLRRAAEMPSLEPPDEKSVRTLYVGGLDERVTEADLKDQFYAYGELESIRVALKSHCAFVTYTTREGAEKAAQGLANRLLIKGLRLRLAWGRPQENKDGTARAKGEEGGDAAGGASLAGSSAAAAGLLPRSLRPSLAYPSMDPERLGSTPSAPPGLEGETQGLGLGTHQGPASLPTGPGSGASEGMHGLRLGFQGSESQEHAPGTHGPPSEIPPHAQPPLLAPPLYPHGPYRQPPPPPHFFTPPQQSHGAWRGRPPPFPPMSAPPYFAAPPPPPDIPPPHFLGPRPGGFPGGPRPPLLGP